MEEKPAGGSDSPASAEPGGSSRRRAGGQKRKSNLLSNLSPNSSTPSKRPTREKVSAPIHPPLYHNGPLTRAARHGPGSWPPPASSAPPPAVKVEEKAASADDKEQERKLQELEATMEAEFEAFRSCGSDSFVVPSHCGWFSWTKIHSIEERSVPSFFNGKSETRTPDVYLKIRNWIMNKFRANTSAQIEVKDLDEVGVGEAEARQEVLEFLDHWGLINFHPFLKLGDVEGAGDGVEKYDLLLEKLFHFEAVQPALVTVPAKVNVTYPTAASRLLVESAIAEELTKAEGPSVEYHCNSCSGDCSRKRYHCQKQADYDLCADCFNDGKFDSDMSSSDFILMEHADAHGISGGKWTDQETLLLLEALEMFEDNWSEIAEHVATKTKAQCILHFLQMPIEDSFSECNEDLHSNSKEASEPAASVNGATAPKEVAETAEGNDGAKKDQSVSQEKEAPKPEDPSQSKLSLEAVKADSESKVIDGKEMSKPEDCSEVVDDLKSSESFAVTVLNEAFEAIGYLPTPETQLSFADIGNPVMALAGFFARLVGPDLATASARYSLKSLSFGSPSLQLASRHSSILEDPPDDIKDSAFNNWTTAEAAEQERQKDDHEHDRPQESKLALTEEDKNSSSNHVEKKVKYLPSDKASSNSPLNDSSQKDNIVSEAGTPSTRGEHDCLKGMESKSSKLPKAHSLGVIKESDHNSSMKDSASNHVKELQESSSVPAHLQVTESVKDVDAQKNGPSNSVVSLEHPLQVVEASRDVDMVSNQMPSEKNELPQMGQSELIETGSEYKEGPKNIDMLPSATAERKELSSQTLSIENGGTSGGSQKDCKRERPGCLELKDSPGVDKLKRAAISALSAAAVKAKLLANQEEDQIRKLAASLVEKQLHKLETKLAFFNDMDSVIMRVREQLERSRQKLFHERAQIIAARLGIPASSSRVMQPQLTGNRAPTNFTNLVLRPPMGMIPQRPSFPRPMNTLVPHAPGQFVSTTPAGTSIRPPG